MLSKWDMADIIMMEDCKERDAALDALSEEDAWATLKSLVSIMRRSHDAAWGREQ